MHAHCCSRPLTPLRHSYVEFVLDVPMYFVYRDGKYVDASGQSFRDFLAGRLPALPGQLPTMGDWESHLTTVFPEVRLKRFLEMRGADNGPWRSICSLPALWVSPHLCLPHKRSLMPHASQVGLLYDEQAQTEAAALIADWTQEERAALRAQVPCSALNTPFRGGTVQQLAQRVVAIAKVRAQAAGSVVARADVEPTRAQGGLERRGLNEAPFLRNLEAIAASGQTAADAMLEAYQTRWGGRGVDATFDEYIF